MEEPSELHEISEEDCEQAVISMCAPSSNNYSKILKFLVNPTLVHNAQIKLTPTIPMRVKTASDTQLLPEAKC